MLKITKILLLPPSCSWILSAWLAEHACFFACAAETRDRTKLWLLCAVTLESRGTYTGSQVAPLQQCMQKLKYRSHYTWIGPTRPPLAIASGALYCKVMT